MTLALNPVQESCSTDTATSIVSTVICLSIAATFSLPNPNEGFDSAALFKIAVRAYSVLILGWLVFSRLRSSVTQRLVVAHFFWIAFTTWAIASTAWSPLKSISLGQAGGLAAMLLLSVGVALTIQNVEKYLLTCLLAIIAYCALYGIGSLVAPGLIEVSRSADNSLVHPTALGAAASLGIVLNIGLLVSGKNNLKGLGWISIVGFPLMLIALLVSHNRLSLVLMLAIGAIALLAKGKTNFLAIAATVFAFLGVAYVVFDPGLIVLDDVFGSSLVFFNRGQTTHQLTELSGRAEMWTKMWDSYLDAPLVGHGYFVSSKTGKLLVWFEEANHTAHNVYLQALVSTGVIGLALFGAWCLSLLRMLLAILIQDSRSSRAAGLAIQGHHGGVFISALIMVWFLGWTALNSSVLGPVRPETVMFAICSGAIVGTFDQRIYGSASRDRYPEQILPEQILTPQVANARRAGV